ncbi:MAG: hypothetical protein FWH17_08400 [Oscillospiraceae bacterium]|nr:hypothetical protein [Oscillospiraceae bacterium]
MKSKMILLAVFMTLLLALFCACSSDVSSEQNDGLDVIDSGIGETAPASSSQANGGEENTSANSNQTDEHREGIQIRMSQWVEVPVGRDFVPEVLKAIEASKTMGDDHEDYFLFSLNKLQEITEFYSLEKTYIEGYALGTVYVNGTNFIYIYLSDKNEITETTYISNRIVISIARQDWVNENLPDTDLLRHALESQHPGNARLTEDDLLYFDNSLIIEARLGGTTVALQPQGIGTNASYEDLRDLILNIVETAKLVTVKG